MSAMSANPPPPYFNNPGLSRNNPGLFGNKAGLLRDPTEPRQVNKKKLIAKYTGLRLEEVNDIS